MRFLAPRESGTHLMHPATSDLLTVLQTNCDNREQIRLDFFGMSFESLSQLAREECYQAAVDYTGQAVTNLQAKVPQKLDSTLPILMAGHQPQLFHPGVWFKNFTLNHWAHTLHAAPINLIIDSDLCRTVSIRVPTCDGGSPLNSASNPIRVETIAYDTPSLAVPYEERTIADRSIWNSFADRVQSAIQPLVSKPLITQFWPIAQEIAQTNNNLGDCLAKARHRMEHDWGNQTLELPLSKVCDTRSFRRLMLHLLVNCQRFRQDHNASVTEYRQANRIRNHAHPVPNLGCDGEWFETPFWMWSSENPVRRALWCKVDSTSITLTNHDSFSTTLPISGSSRSESAVELALEKLSELREQGIKIRSRALLTTMVARLFLSDLFLHGIGGAKYDQVTDGIMERFFNVTPPAYAVLSGTLHLPIERSTASGKSLRSINQQLRELTFHPERFVTESDGEIGRLVAQKRDAIRIEKTLPNARERHKQITQANEGLQKYVADQRAALESQLQPAQQSLRETAILESREYAFCLFPPEMMRNFLHSS